MLAGDAVPNFSVIFRALFAAHRPIPAPARQAQILRSGRPKRTSVFRFSTKRGSPNDGSLSYISPVPESLGFPPPWTVDEATESFGIRDANGQALAHVYCEDEPGRRAAANLLTRDEARRIASNIAKLPVLLRLGKPIKRDVGPLLLASRNQA